MAKAISSCKSISSCVVENVSKNMDKDLLGKIINLLLHQEIRKVTYG